MAFRLGGQDIVREVVVEAKGNRLDGRDSAVEEKEFVAGATVPVACLGEAARLAL